MSRAQAGETGDEKPKYGAFFKNLKNAEVYHMGYGQFYRDRLEPFSEGF